MIDINNLDKLYEKLDSGEFCCKQMHYEIVLFENKCISPDGLLMSSICYEKQSRRYGILHNKTPNDYGYFCQAIYCPWCGKKLPKELDPWNTIYNEYGDDYVKYPGDSGYKPLPPEVKKEFETDEWWKKRNIGPDDPGF